jgi:hypothetical protein
VSRDAEGEAGERKRHRHKEGDAQDSRFRRAFSPLFGRQKRTRLFRLDTVTATSIWHLGVSLLEYGSSVEAVRLAPRPGHKLREKISRRDHETSREVAPIRHWLQNVTLG